MNAIVIQKIKEAPAEPGVYVFYGSTRSTSSGQASSPQASGDVILYIGKASNLKNRLKSYLKVTDIKTEMLHEEADRLEYVVLNSEIEALIEESRLIKERRPKLNVLWMDDKTYSYVYFTRDKFPKVFISHATPPRRKSSVVGYSRIGPFTDGGMLRTAMKILRRSFPYCTCFRPHLRDCLNSQIGLCLGACCKKQTDDRQPTTNDQYRKNIRAIKAILTGKKTGVIANNANKRGNIANGKNLTKDEQAALKNIAAHRNFLDTDTPFVNSDAIRNSFMNSLKRVECYDNSNFAGKEAVGAMTVLTRNDSRLTTNDKWLPDKNSYRKFKIKSAPTQDDPRMIGEILSRRLNHPEWPYPDLIVIDGGLMQYNAAKRVLDEFHKRHTTNDLQLTKNIQLVSYAKPQRKVIGLANAPRELQELIEKAIYQTHRFVINYHRQVRSKEFIPRK